MRVNCQQKDCKAFIDVDGATEKTIFICREHTGYDPKNTDIHFQSIQHDRDLDQSAAPQGTGHIMSNRRPGSEPPSWAYIVDPDTLQEESEE